MDKENLVENIRYIFSKFDTQKYGYNLLMIYKDDLSDPTWNIGVSASWIDDKPMREIIFSILTLLQEKKELKPFINKIMPIQSTSAVVAMFNQAYQIKDSGYIDLSNIQLGEVNIPVLLIIELSKIAGKDKTVGFGSTIVTDTTKMSS